MSIDAKIIKRDGGCVVCESKDKLLAYGLECESKRQYNFVTLCKSCKQKFLDHCINFSHSPRRGNFYNWFTVNGGTRVKLDEIIKRYSRYNKGN